MASNPPGEAQVLRSIERLVSDALPPGWSLRARRKRKGQTRRVDPAWELRSPDGQVAVFAPEMRRALTGRQLDTVRAQVATHGRLPLLTAPFLSPTLRTTLAEQGVSYADTTGNLLLMADRPGLFVERHGATKDPWPPDDSLQSLRGRGAGRAIRALVDFPPPYGIRELAARASVPLGSLSRTLVLLEREGLVTRGDRGQVRDLDWEGVLRRWAQDYEFARSNRVTHYIDPRGISAVTARLSTAGWAYALTGAAAAQTFAPVAPARRVTLYIDDPDLAAGHLRLRPADAGANVALAEPFDPVVFDRTTERDGLRIVAVSQLAVDLLTGTGREPSEGIEILRWMRTDRDGRRG